MRHFLSAIVLLTASVVFQSNAAAETCSVSEDGEPVDDQQAYHLWVSGGAAAHTYTCEIESGSFVMGEWTADGVITGMETLNPQYSGPPAFTYIGHGKHVTLQDPAFFKYRFRFKKNGTTVTDVYKPD